MTTTCQYCGKPIDPDADAVSITFTDPVTHTHTTCRAREEIEEYQEKGTLTDRVLLYAAFLGSKPLRKETQAVILDHEHTLMRAQAEQADIAVRVKDFERDVWFNGLQDFIRNEPSQGHTCTFSGPTGQVSIQALSLAGRWRMTLEAPDGAFVDVITAEDASPEHSPMGLNHIRATKQEALALLDACIEAWAAGRMNLKAEKVLVLGV